MIMKEKKAITKQLDTQVTQLVEKFGFEKSIGLIKSITDSGSIVSDTNKLELTIDYLKSKTTDVFNISETVLLNSIEDEARKARMCNYYLLVRYLGMSYAHVGKYFKQTKRAIRYNYKKFEEILSIKSYYKELYARFEVLEHVFMNYLIHLNLS